MFIFSQGQRAILSGILLVAVFCHAPSEAQSAESEAAEHFHAAQHYQQLGQLEAAAAEYRAAQKLQPNVPEIDIDLGLVYYAQAKFNESAQALGAAQKLRPGMHGVALWLGIDDVKLHHPQEGAALLREALRQNADDKVAQAWLGTALWNAGESTASLLQMESAVRRFPSDPDLLFQLGEAYGKAANQECESLLKTTEGTALSDRIYAYLYADQHDWSKAEGHLTRALQRDPSSVEARLELADVLLSQAKLRAAEQQLDAAAKLAPKRAGVLARTGELLLLKQEIPLGVVSIEAALQANQPEALNALGLPIDDEQEQTRQSSSMAPLCKQAAEQMPTGANASSARHAALAVLEACAGETGRAMHEFQSIPQTHTEQSAAVNTHAVAREAIFTHHYGDAEESLERWLALHSGDHEAQFELITVRKHLAIVLIDRLLAASPDSYHLHQLLGQLDMDREEDEKALAEYSALATERPDMPGVHYWLGHLDWKHGKADEAKKEFTRELELDPDNANAQEELGAVLVSDVQIEEAILHLKAAIENNPDLWAAYLQLGKAYYDQKNYALAETAIRKALPHDMDGAALYQLAQILRAEGKSDEARQAFLRVREIKQEQLTPFVAAGAQEGAQP
jgi:tetratricopeptide (TPR) repeat protein